MASTITPNKAKSSTTPNHVDKGARECAISRIDSVLAISVNSLQRFDQARIANGKQRSSGHKSQISECERRADGYERKQIPDARMEPGAVQRGQHNDIDVEHLHAQRPSGDNGKLTGMFFDR